VGELELPFGLATSVGPVPVDDVDAAVDAALGSHARFPTAPVVAGPAGSLLAQAVDGVSGIRVDGGRLDVDPSALPDLGDPTVGGIEGPAFVALRSFLARLDERDAADVLSHGPVRIPLLGPVTLTLALRTAGVAPSHAVAAAGCLVGRRSTAALSALRAAAPEATAVVVLSEPGLIGAMHPTFPLSPGQTRSLLDPVVDGLDRHPGAGRMLIGVHVPGRTDWATILGSGVSLVSTPVDPGLVGWAPALSQHLEAGGWIAWGAVPVDRPLGTNEQILWRRLTETWNELAAVGVDPMLVRLHSMVSPADGLAHFGPSQAERVLDLTSALSTRVRRQTIAARLSLGA
jgi:hypothetical protein